MSPKGHERPIVACLHPYLEGRREEIAKGLYPKHHLWGLESIERTSEWKTEWIRTSEIQLPGILEKWFDKTIFRGSPGVKVELAALQAAKRCDLLYSVCGPLALVRRFRQARLVSWVFREPPLIRAGLRLAHAAYRPERLSSHAGFLCLTPNAEESFRRHAPSRFLPWCVDFDLFDGKPAQTSPERPFFFATGKTERDYATLVSAASKVDAEVRIIGPALVRPAELPENVRWLDTSADPPDQTVDYPMLRQWYAQCIAVCIPLTGDADDTCGYTNLLEGMAMGKPVLMTKSGCLHLNPEAEGCGLWVRPNDVGDWRNKMNMLMEKADLACKMGKEGRALTERDYSPARFDRDVVAFLQELLR